MPDVIPADSVRLVEPRAIRFSQSLPLNCGEQLDGFQLMIETYGELNPSRSTAVLIFHALSGHHHAAGYHSMEDRKPGWWDNCIGPGKPIDTRRFFVVALNNLGDCHGSTGPTNPNPETWKAWGPDILVVTVADWVNSQVMLADYLGIWVESYLRYQGESFSGSFDANTYLLMTRVLDYFDPATDYDKSLANALSRATAKFFLASFSTDWRFSPERSREMVDALMPVKM